MVLTPGVRLGVYQLTAKIGEGGMGQVFLARDTTLDRDVAIKTLPEAFAHDAERLARFQREAKTLASLNHPHIAAIYGLEQSNGIAAIVMELVEGEDLSQRIARGAIPIDDALPIAKQVADALEAAHEQGVIHRDLKPANIKVRSDGTVKVLDFGLAKALDKAGESGRAGGAAGVNRPNLPGLPDFSASPTITSPAMLTGAGMILGTAAYMSPEQAKGRPADRRSDVWAFGAVLYEMLTGKRAFTGHDVSDTLVSVMRDEPDWSALPHGVSASTRQTLQACLQKDPRRRVRDFADIALALDGAFEPPAQPTSRKSASFRDPLVLAVAGIAAAATLVAIYLALRPTAVVDAPERLLRLSISPPSDARLPSGTSNVALSPDGSHVVFLAVGSDGRSQLWLRALDRPRAQPVANSQNAAGWVFWAPDSRSFGFGNDGKLRIVDIATGRSRVVADSPGFRGGSWAPGGTILFAASESGGLFRVAAEGGTPVSATTVDNVRGEISHRMPSVLPDGRHFVYRIEADREDVSGIYLGSLAGDVKQRLLGADSQALFVPQGFLMSVVNGTLFAHRFDVSSLRLEGAPTPLAQQVTFSAITHTASFSASVSGAVAYRTGTQGTQSYDLQWFDRRGTSLETLKLPAGYYANLDLSGSGKIAVEQTDRQGTTDVWVIDSPGTPPKRVTFGPPSYGAPMWSPDERRLLLFSRRPGPGSLFTRNASGQGDDDMVVPSADRSYPAGWSPDGKLVVYATRQPETNWDLYVVNVDGDRHPQPFARSAFNEQLAQFSPNGRWIAYTSDESSANEVYVQSFPASDSTKVRVSTAGGFAPRWRRDGRELFYLQSDRTLMAVDVTSEQGGLRFGAPHALFSAPWIASLVLNPSGQTAGYAPSADGQRFLMTHQTMSEPQQIDLILNWPALLKERPAEGRQ